MNTLSNEAMRLYTIEDILRFTPQTQVDYRHWRSLYRSAILYLAMLNRKEKWRRRWAQSVAVNGPQKDYLEKRLRSAEEVLEFTGTLLKDSVYYRRMTGFPKGGVLSPHPNIPGRMMTVRASVHYTWRLREKFLRLKALHAQKGGVRSKP